METVFEANLALDAHLVRDLLERAGIPATVEGEYLQGAAGELPLGGLVRVCVSPDRAKEAREVIAEWEQRPVESGATAPDPAPPPRKKSSWAPFTFVLGGALGFFAAWYHFNTPVASDGVDYNNDGKLDEHYVYEGTKVALLEYDRNGDGFVDLRYDYDSHGIATGSRADEDFDGKFEGRSKFVNGQPSVLEIDRNGDGFFEEVGHFENGVLAQYDYVSFLTRTVVKRSYFRSGALISADYDADSDGKFERRVEYDEKGDPLP